MDFTQIIKMTQVLEEQKLQQRINEKVSDLIDDIDLNDIKKSEIFNNMLAYCLAAKTAGMTLPKPF